MPRVSNNGRGSGCSTSGERGGGCCNSLSTSGGFFVPLALGWGGHKTCPFSLQVTVYLSLDGLVQPPCLCYQSPLHVLSEQIGKKKRSNFTPQLEFLKSEIGIPIERNFPAGREHYELSCSSVENTLYLPIVL